MMDGPCATLPPEITNANATGQGGACTTNDTSDGNHDSTSPERGYGATQDEWNNFTLMLGLTNDLLPVVSNPGAQISPDSKMRAIGKTPSYYNSQRKVVGFAGWPEHIGTNADIASWSSEPDYGICVITRSVRGLDVDVSDEETATAIHTAICDIVGILPRRVRSNSAKFLLAFRMDGDYPKRVLRTAHGAIEALMNGQQFVACGTHPTRTRYEWLGGLPDDIPMISLEQFERLWRALEERYAIEPSVKNKVSTKAVVLNEAIRNDLVAQFLIEKNLVLSSERDGRLHLKCPFSHEHTTESSDSATTYLPAHTGGYTEGHFKCQHAHCRDRDDDEFKDAIGYSNHAEDFDTIEGTTDQIEAFRGSDIEFIDFNGPRSTPRDWVVDQWIARNTVTALFGKGAVGKSLVTQQLGNAVATGESWLGMPVCESAPVIGFFCEDDANELKLRHERITASAFDTRAPNNLHLQARVGMSNLLMTFGTDRRGRETAFLKAVRAQCDSIRPALLILDNIAQLYGGLENDRGQVTQFCNTLSGLAHEFNLAVLLLGHPAKSVDSEFSGSTAWENALRTRLLLVRQEDGTTMLVKAKANYSTTAQVILQYQGPGLFVPVSAGSDTAAVEGAKTAILEAVAAFTRREQATSHLTTARNYLVKLMQAGGQLGGIPSSVAGKALAALIDEGEIVPNCELPWKTASRHKAHGLSLKNAS